MKQYALAMVPIMGVCLGVSAQQLTYNNHPVITAQSTYTEYRIDEDWYKGQWSIAPHVEHDTLKVTCLGESTLFLFKTDSDSIQFNITSNSNKDFYVKLDDTTYAHTIVQGVSFPLETLSFEKGRNQKIGIKYLAEPNDYLEELKASYPLEFVKAGKKNEDVVLEVLNWTSSRWQHNGNNTPSKSDAITILNEAKAGQRFPCFAFATVLKDQLNANGYHARKIYLKTKDAAHRKGSPGHVATEVYVDDLQKWIFIDGQFNVMPFLDGRPLNAIEFQDAITHHFDRLELKSLGKELISKKNYVNFVYPYLYYFDTTLDNRYKKREDNYTIDGKRGMMLVPVGAENLTHIDFWDMDIDYCIYTHSVEDFYAKPN